MTKNSQIISSMEKTAIKMRTEILKAKLSNDYLNNSEEFESEAFLLLKESIENLLKNVIDIEADINDLEP